MADIRQRQAEFLKLRQQHPVFLYKAFKIDEEDGGVRLTFDFEIQGLCGFSPHIFIETDNLKIINAFSGTAARKIIFALGMTELVSYWKAACCPEIRVLCGSLSQEDILFWKKLYYNGLGEFFYVNGIAADFDSFVSIKSEAEEPEETEPYEVKYGAFANLIPVGGGKDSAVTMELLKAQRDKSLLFTVNSQQARTDTAKAAGFSESDIIKTRRSIDPALLELNSKGYLNGHTPFSAIVAFLSFYCAYLTGCKYIILSNEGSASEANIAGSDVNHQYSKSFAFESDFRQYISDNIKEAGEIRYFSLLRPFSELQIAKQFAEYKNQHKHFRSCNVGSRKNLWCCKCAKCLFVYIMLAPFMGDAQLTEIFGTNLFEDKDLLKIFRGLTGLDPLKPFECVGTADEANEALELRLKRSRGSGEKLPFLLEYYEKHSDEIKRTGNSALTAPLSREHHVPAEFSETMGEMYNFVSRTD